MVVLEAAYHGTPSIVVAGEDNAATELIEPEVNGLIVTSADPDAIAGAVVRVHDAGIGMRESTARWFQQTPESGRWRRHSRPCSRVMVPAQTTEAEPPPRPLRAEPCCPRQAASRLR